MLLCENTCPCHPPIYNIFISYCVSPLIEPIDLIQLSFSWYRSCPRLLQTKALGIPFPTSMTRTWTVLHDAAAASGCTNDEVSAILSGGAIDIDQADLHGWTPLMVAAACGSSSVVKVLLTRGASASIVGDEGVSALHLAAREGHVAVAKTLVQAGADMELGDSQGDTPLNDATERGQSEVMSVLIEAGANIHCRGFDGSTPLFIAAQLGHLNAVKVLLRAGVNPLLVNKDAGKPYGALDAAAQSGHPKVVRELVQHRGIEGCGGISRGNIALEAAAQYQRLESMAVLFDAGVVDKGPALAIAAGCGTEASVKYLLQQKKGGASGRRAYVNSRDPCGETAMTCCVGYGMFPSPSPRIMRLLVDAGADTRSKARILDAKGKVVFHDTLVALAARNLREKKVGGKGATEEQLNRLEGVRRLLLRVDAVHALSWLWPSGSRAPMMVHGGEGKGRATAAPTAITGMLPTLRRTARRPGVLVAALFRWAPT